MSPKMIRNLAHPDGFLRSIAGAAAASLFILAGVPGTMAQHAAADFDPCLTQACAGLTVFEPAQISKPGLLEFEIDADDPLGQAFVNQVIDLVHANLNGWAVVKPDPTGLDALGNLKINLSSIDTKSQPSNLDEGLNESADLDVLTEPAFKWTISGSIVQEQEDLTELSLTLTPSINAQNDIQILTIRSGIQDWDRVAHYLSDLIFEDFDIRHGLFQSQVLFIARKGDEDDEERRLAFMDQSGDGLTWIEAAGTHVGFATFLENRFDIAYLDQTDGNAHLVYHNLLTNRSTPLVQLPDLVGRPDIGAAGRFIAFASREDGAENQRTDMLLVDVESAIVQGIPLTRTREQDPSFSPDLSSLAMVSVGDAGSKILMVNFAEPLNTRDRTKGQSPLGQGEPEITDLYETVHDLAAPTWSSDGRHLAFVENDGEGSHLMILDMETQEVTRLASGARLAHPVWSPHPDFIVLVAQAENQERDQLIRLNIRQGDVRVLPTPFEPEAPAWSPYQP